MTFRPFLLAGSAALFALLLPSCALETLAPPMGRSGDQLVFSGRTWTVKGGTELFGPGPNYFSKDLYSAYTDSLGHLHLNIRQIDGRWYCSEVISNDNLGYGTYKNLSEVWFNNIETPAQQITRITDALIDTWTTCVKDESTCAVIRGGTQALVER
jgi:hypothetical protein